MSSASQQPLPPTGQKALEAWIKDADNTSPRSKSEPKKRLVLVDLPGGKKEITFRPLTWGETFRSFFPGGGAKLKNIVQHCLDENIPPPIGFTKKIIIYNKATKKIDSATLKVLHTAEDAPHEARRAACVEKVNEAILQNNPKLLDELARADELTRADVLTEYGPLLTNVLKFLKPEKFNDCFDLCLNKQAAGTTIIKVIEAFKEKCEFASAMLYEGHEGGAELVSERLQLKLYMATEETKAFVKEKLQGHPDKEAILEQLRTLRGWESFTLPEKQ